MTHYNISSSGLAKKIGVQRSVISHLFSGRNKPSLSFLIKVEEAFPEVSIEWLLKGVGDFPKPLVSPSSLEESFTPTPTSNKADKRIVNQIVIFYSDKTFEIYKP